MASAVLECSEHGDRFHGCAANRQGIEIIMIPM